ncbi:glucosamine-6-phosphate deaminase [Paenibacillus sp. 1011MAR3C5]|uniref:glucosamine-6-phosphate deaminase n=1 Tax=Paenibacillus sp. 1011MAR3C5 TaxID=1675787 RepID=UPI000E6B58EC|nr:glucosamine-6-phosphate deaminase [Paenibacillus sp. 1011MAR3C5]RJE91089.1 glucosamine-6-phosphate deaminase [Paenibacillus sp. 1011MAR3C5]
MDIRIFETSEELDLYAAEIFRKLINEKPNAVLGLATGSTPVGIYAKMVEDYTNKKVSFSGVTTYNLDEYVGLTPDNDQSYAYYMNKNLFSHVDIPAIQTHLPDGMAEDPQEECVRYEAMINACPADIQLLGLGHNGHIAFNEPDEQLSAGTHVVKLKEETLEANARFFASIDDVPKEAYTMGIGSILKANTILLVVRGSDKAHIVKEALTGPITTQVPASLLQTHPRVTVLLDREAGRMLG